MNFAEIMTAARINPEYQRTEIEWNGHTVPVYVRRPSYAQVEQAGKDNPEHINVALIAACCQLGEDRQQLTADDILAMDTALALKLGKAAEQVLTNPLT